MCKNAAMTYSTLSGIHKTITRREEKLARLRSQACVTSARLDKPTGGSGYYDRIGSLAAEIADLEGELETLRESYKAALDALGSDSLAACCIRMKLSRGMTWQEIACRIGMTEAAVKVMCRRYVW